MRRALSLAVVTLLVVSCGSAAEGPEISDARVGQPTGPNAALYFTATSDGDADRLVGATTDLATAVELHETTMSDDGTMSMAAVGGLDLPAGGELILQPGGYHLMLIDARPMEVGDIVEVTITWKESGEMTVDAEVVDPGDTMGHDG